MLLLLWTSGGLLRSHVLANQIWSNGLVVYDCKAASQHLPERYYSHENYIVVFSSSSDEISSNLFKLTQLHFQLSRS